MNYVQDMWIDGGEWDVEELIVNRPRNEHPANEQIAVDPSEFIDHDSLGFTKYEDKHGGES